MLFDEKDMQVFDNTESRNYFKEILQSYYSQNYRATIVLLYSFVIYDLFIKMQTMANEGDKKANKKLSEINGMIEDDEKYSKVENEIIQFFKDTCPLYFNRFIEDIDYLKNCRNKCAHLKVDDNSLFLPSDYHAKMLICSMYDNILSVKAPFIMDLFSIAQTDIEKYSESLSFPFSGEFDESVKKSIINKYLKRMTYDSLKKSYKTFTRLLFVSDNEECIKNTTGLYAFTYSMTDYIIKEGHYTIFKDENIINNFSKIEIASLKDNRTRRNALIEIISTYSVLMDIIRGNNEVFEYLSNKVLLNPRGLSRYRTFYPREDKSIYEFFKDNPSIQQSAYSETIYNAVKECDDFDLAEFMLIMVKSIPTYNGFYDADHFICFFKEHMTELTIDQINNVLEIYKKNGQCTNRARHSSDIKEIQKYIEDSTDNKL